MADTVDVKQISSGPRRYATRLTNQCDGTGEAGVIKIDISTFTDSNGKVCTYTAIDRIEYAVAGFNYVVLAWDHTTDDEIAVLSGNGVIDASMDGSLIDPKTVGGTGDILLTTDGAADGCSYDITIYWRPKAA